MVISFLTQQAPSDLIDRVKQALTISGAAGWSQTELKGSAEYYGSKDTYSLTFSEKGGFVQTFTGPVGETFGFDGKTFWQIDRCRGVQKLDFEDRDRETVVGLVLTSGWTASPSSVKVAQDGYTLNLTIKESGVTAKIKIDPATNLPVEATVPVSSGDLVLKVSKWKPAGSRMVPSHAEITEGGLTDKIDVDTIGAYGGDASARYQVPNWKPDDIVFDTTKPLKIEAKKAISGHMLVHPLVNGKDIGWFILDSGAEVMVIDKGIADEMKLESVGKEPLTGVGGTVEGAIRKVDSFTLGQATVSKLLFSELELAPIGQFLGVKLAGIVGGDFLRRSIVTMDFKEGTVEVSSRDSYKLPSGQWLAMRFSSGNPAVEAAADGSPKSWYRFDTGANGTVTFHSPFVKKYKLLDGRKTTATGSGGVGGTIVTQGGTIKWFELGGHRFENPFVQFTTGTQGALAEPYLAGNIGQDFMMPFRVVIDFSGYRLALIPR